jgi:hypothetical protein
MENDRAKLVVLGCAGLFALAGLGTCGFAAAFLALRPSAPAPPHTTPAPSPVESSPVESKPSPPPSAPAAPIATEPSSDAVAPELVGSWHATIHDARGDWSLTFTVQRTGSYRTTFQGPTAAPDETGTFTAGNGTWHLARAGGKPDEGTYTLRDPDTLSLAGKRGTLTWTRVRENGSKHEAAPAAPPVMGELVKAVVGTWETSFTFQGKPLRHPLRSHQSYARRSPGRRGAHGGR